MFQRGPWRGRRGRLRCWARRQRCRARCAKQRRSPVRFSRSTRTCVQRCPSHEDGAEPAERAERAEPDCTLGACCCSTAIISTCTARKHGDCSSKVAISPKPVWSSTWMSACLSTLRTRNGSSSCASDGLAPPPATIEIAVAGGGSATEAGPAHIQ